MSYENSAGIGVYASYGKRDTGGSIGLEQVDNSTQRLSIAFTGASLNSGFLPPVYVPRGAKVLRYTLRVDEAFSLTGTSPVVNFGGTAPGTNGVVLTEAELEAIGTKVPASTGNGTWAISSATGTTASEKVTKSLGGTSPVVSPTVGKGTLIIEYLFKTKV
jgi:hypothetical protein